MNANGPPYRTIIEHVFIVELKKKKMEEKRGNQIEQVGMSFEVDHQVETDLQDGTAFEQDTFNGNHFLRELMADEIAEGM